MIDHTHHPYLKAVVDNDLNCASHGCAQCIRECITWKA